MKTVADQINWRIRLVKLLICTKLLFGIMYGKVSGLPHCEIDLDFKRRAGGKGVQFQTSLDVPSVLSNPHCPDRKSVV